MSMKGELPHEHDKPCGTLAPLHAALRVPGTTTHFWLDI